MAPGGAAKASSISRGRTVEGVSRSLSGLGVSLGVAAFEVAVLSIATFLAAATYLTAGYQDLDRVLFYVVPSLFIGLMYVLCAGVSKSYRVQGLASIRASAPSAVLAFQVSFSIVIAVLFMSRATDLYSRGALIAQYGTGLAVVLLARIVVAAILGAMLRAGRITAQRVLVIGSVQTLRDVEATLGLSTGVQLVSVVLADDALDEAANLDLVARDMVGYCRASLPNHVILALPARATPALGNLLERLSPLPTAVHVVPDRTEFTGRMPVLAEIGSMQTLRLSRPPLTLGDQLLKRLLDIVVASTALVLLAPLMLLIAVCIRMESSGPALFRQRRFGFNQKEFRIYKFRSMRVQEDGAVVTQAKRFDSRITRVGALLRRTNLDELPQLLNVLRGEMSLVGPRPHALVHDLEFETQVAQYARRHNVKPGITGWAQVNGLRGETDTLDKLKMRVEHDIFYIDNWSLALDLRILLLTVCSPKAFRNAY
jgi:Undecaprenyl-phosphate glucose phosphotransferase